ncbi:MAG: restriction endonuclease [Gammaproteobacteria bacterium]|nr:restriction endonuclease [Gammaproteobacteria bacterium]
MTRGKLAELREHYHQSLFEDLVRIQSGRPNNADKSSKSSVQISRGVIERIGLEVKTGAVSGQAKGSLFEAATRAFLRQSFEALEHLRPGLWHFSVGGNIWDFEQYRHLRDIKEVVDENRELQTVFGDYIVRPDIVVSRSPLADDEVNEAAVLLAPDDIGVADRTPLREANADDEPVRILHASVSCKWTIRSDRSQNARTEGLNLIRNRKGKTPHIVAVTGEPLPSRIASLAFGTGDIDCVYHFALAELLAATKAEGNETDGDLLETMVRGSRLRDISDLPFDLIT